MNKIKNHFLSKRNYYITAGIITVLFLIIYACYGAFPFGTKTLAHYDLLHQVVPFLDLVLDAFDGSGTLIFSNTLAGGANIVGFLCYFIFSPFYLIVLLFGKNNLLYSINIAFIVQVIAIALVFLWFIRKYFNLSQTYQILISLAYGLNMYVLFNYTWFSWLYLTMLMPILAHNFLKLIKHGKITGLTITIVLMIFNCYGVGMFGQVIIFILCSLFIFTVVPKQKRKVSMAKLLLCYGLALAVSLFMLGPNALQLSDSSRLGSFTYGFINDNLFKNLGTGVAYLLLDSVLLCLSIFFVIKFNKKSKYSQFLLGSLVLCVIPFLIDGITLVLTMGGYYGYQTRLSYILTFVMFLVSIVTIKSITRKQEAENTKIEKFTQRSILIWIVVGIVFAIGVSALFYKAISTIFSEGRIPNESVILIIVFTAMFVLALVFAFVQFKKGKVSKKFFQSALLIVFCFQHLINPVLFTGEGYSSTDKYTFLAEQCETLKAEDYRLKDYDSTFGSNLHLLTNFSSYSCFASQINANVVNTAMGLGYKYTSNLFESSGGTILADSFMGYKYFYSKEEVVRPYLTEIAKCEGDKDEIYYLYENSLVLNNAIVVGDNKSLDLTQDGFVGTQSLYEYLGGEGEVITKTSLETIIEQNNFLLNNGKIDYNSKTINYNLSSENDNAILTINVQPSNYNKLVYITFEEDKENDNKLFVFDYGDYSTQPQAICAGMFYEQGYVTSGSSFSFDVEFVDQVNFNEINVCELNYDMVSELLTNVQQQNVEFKFTKSGFKANVNATENQKLIITNTNINGNVVSNNGNQVTVANLPLMEVDLVDGQNQVESTFKFPYLRTVIVAGVVGIICLVIVIIINKCLLKYNVVKNILYYTSVSVVILFTAVVYFVPSLIFIVRLCLFKI